MVLQEKKSSSPVRCPPPARSLIAPSQNLTCHHGPGVLLIWCKISPYQQGAERARAAALEILQRLDSSYVDLLLIHWPGASKTKTTDPANAKLRLESWRVLEELYEQGKLKAIGVSNYEESHLKELASHAKIMPMVNQVEVHPQRPNTCLRQLCQDLGIAVVAYASLGCGHLLQNPIVLDVAQQTGKSPAQVLLRWGLQKGCAVIPKAANPGHLIAAGELLNWELPGDLEARLDGLENGTKYCWDPSGIA
ncbi:NADP-dependent oxidoreductase domain-containing protein [Dunaliella salina]|uniref:NADP-dependent oxidoreductase domain-containing protein n=1 Tax=Dunaliella salina TaxID=3046 RepID=A0ABQ7G2V4_DUNSA|nr:NADP-dependent oxidoreductase domain-containing protein [Dunaliella salina]|eukprot:KAF5828937.1 NADP-dependent oxidoreductase domain-containing protein [Dunaliella salina]